MSVITALADIKIWGSIEISFRGLTLSPWHVVLVALAGWLNREQQKAIEYLKEENRVLREQLGTKRLGFTDEQRRRLAVKGKEPGIKLLRELGCIVTPDIILRWYRELIAKKYDESQRSPTP